MQDYQQSHLRRQLPEILLDLWLTAHGGRQACLHEICGDDWDMTQNCLKARVDMSEISRRIFDFAEEIGLTWVLERTEKSVYLRSVLFSREVLEEPRFDDDAYLRKILGFTLGKVDYTSRQRASLNPNIFAFVQGWDPSLGISQERSCIGLFGYHGEPELQVIKVEKQRLKSWRKILRVHPFPWAKKVNLSLMIRPDDGIMQRKMHMYDWKYVRDNYEAFLGDVCAADASKEDMTRMSTKPLTEEECKDLCEFWLRFVQQ